MTYNKKQMQPLIDKFAINPETNKLFISIMEMFDGQPNYQLWGAKMIFSKYMEMEELVFIHDWVSNNSNLVKQLEKHNIVSYGHKSDVATLIKEINGLNNISLIKNTINNFNTAQRKILNDEIFPKDYTPIEAYNNTNIKYWSDVFKKFLRLPAYRRTKFFSNCSRLKTSKTLLEAIKVCLNESYEWNKADFLAYMKNNASDCEIVFEKGNYVIIRVPSFESSRLLCGNGRTKWCISRELNFFEQYVTSYSNRAQYFYFDFNREECDDFAHIGFTMEDGKRFYCAQTCNNEPMITGHSQGDEKLSITDVLTKCGCSMSTFLRLNKLENYRWEESSILKLVESMPNNFSIVYSKDGRYIISINSNMAANILLSHSLVGYNNFEVNDSHKLYALLDTNLKWNDQHAIVVMFYEKDEYGFSSLTSIKDIYNTDITSEKYLSKLGISRDDYIKHEEIDAKVLLHKYLDEGDEIAAIKLIESEGKDFDVNYEYNNKYPILTTINNKLFAAFDTIINHDAFDASTYDGFGETLLETLTYLYGADQILTTEEDVKALERMIKSVINSKKYDFNVKDVNNDTALNIACEYPKMSWIAKMLISKKDVDVNVVNDFKLTALDNCLMQKNFEVLSMLGQRPDLVVTEEHKKLAKKQGIDLNEYIKPNESVFGSFIPEDKVEEVAEMHPIFEELMVEV